jgi:branched-chain amino acid aminotransferase
MQVWMNGQLVDAQGAHVPVGTHALHYGSGVFEGVRAYETERGAGIWCLDAHLERLRRSAAAYQMDVPFTQEQLAEAIWQLLEVNGQKSAYIRPIVFRGAGRLGVDPTGLPVETAIMTMNWGSYLGEEGMLHGIRACMSPYQRISTRAMPSHAKATGQYLNSILAKLDANDRGFEEAILLSQEGLVSEGTGENVFVVSGGRVRTPRLSDSILPGITRSFVIDALAGMGIELVEAAINPSELSCADEVFLTGTAAEITPVRQIDETVIGEPGPVTRAVQDLFARTTAGEATAFAHLMTYSG